MKLICFRRVYINIYEEQTSVKSPVVAHHEDLSIQLFYFNVVVLFG